jgi:hypothetical protein
MNIPYTGTRLTADEVLVALGCVGVHPSCSRAVMHAATFSGVQPVVIKRGDSYFEVTEGVNQDEDPEFMYALRTWKAATP